MKQDAEQAEKAKRAYQNRQKSKGNRWGAPVPQSQIPPASSKFTSSSCRASQSNTASTSNLAGKKRDTSLCANPHKLRFRWDPTKFKYDRKFFEKLFEDYYDIKEEELYEFRDGYCFVYFREDIDALDANQKALELKPKPLK